ncbi:MAG TPA: metalloregulator ArsR/SmtB family transcription factor [Paracoccaceae bacterium]|nr:metalloregulator ArsR/SmtB family transcription factor [Paracoccaceae bacterium]
MALPVVDMEMTDNEIEEVLDSAKSATEFMKALAHEGRLMILCHLVGGEKSVTDLEKLLATRQAAVSQQLARLRLEGLVRSRRDGKTIYYSLSDPRAIKMIELVYDMFCTFDPEKPSNDSGETAQSA